MSSIAAANPTDPETGRAEFSYHATDSNPHDAATTNALITTSDQQQLHTSSTTGVGETDPRPSAPDTYHSIPESGDAYLGIFQKTINSAPFSGIFSLEQSRQHGHDQEIHSTPFSFFRCDAAHRKTFVQACYLGVAAMIGTLVRLIMAQLFGQACSNPGTIGWIADDAALCVTSNGAGQQMGGIIFADLPANILGCFIMGLLQDGAALDLAIHVPLAFLAPNHALQAYEILHLALKTGFCGSLTTFSGWNSEMVIMLAGREATNRPSQVWKALLGYIVGIETSLGSYVFGRTLAWWLYQWQNPDLALEQEAMKIRKYQHGIAINHSLPTLERRYLHRLFELPETTDTTLVPTDIARRLSPADTLTSDELAPLMRWRDSTKEARRAEHELSGSLMDLETTLIAQKQPVTPEIRSNAMKNGWDIAALEVWMAKRYNPLQDEDQLDNVKGDLNNVGILKPLTEDTTLWYSSAVAALCWLVFIGILILLIFHWTAETAYDITYRTMAYSMIYATPGALLRWKLSSWNGQLNSFDWKWLPVGTLAANILGAMVSISMIGWEYNMQMVNENGFWGIATLRAIKIGFSGCLTTVSTFISEVHKLTLMRQDRGYKYILITLIVSCVVGVILFVVIV
ncbi:CrcB-like domain containing protein [Nitzschia inconspicua]|uniref:CrcB-like domain containing protein n=1 Tax=Nitzschia inconspicua TaxID=303405 RepID=A0A9K3M546_9STRA|nr:CrcB-like domain containing protein [Nitzschia inconspicua]